MIYSVDFRRQILIYNVDFRRQNLTSEVGLAHRAERVDFLKALSHLHGRTYIRGQRTRWCSSMLVLHLCSAVIGIIRPHNLFDISRHRRIMTYTENAHDHFSV